jgi:hypothetical protein
VPEGGVNHRALQGFLSSKIADFLLKQVSSVYGGRYYSYADQFLKDLPICEPLLKKTSGEAKKTGALAEEISGLSTERLSLSRKLATFPESFGADLSQYELETVKSLLHKQPQSENLKLDHDAIRVEQALYGFEVHFGNQSPFEFEAREHAECLAEAMRNRKRQTLSRKEVLSWRLPVTPAGCKKLLESLAKAESKLEKVRGQITSKEGSLNEVIFSMFGLNNEDEKVIEGFLDRYSSGPPPIDLDEQDEVEPSAE